MWSKEFELRYWNQTGLDKGSTIYDNYCLAFNIDIKSLKGKKIADIGCGPFGGVLCHHPNLDVTPIDILATEYNKLKKSPKSIVEGDLSGELPFEKESFDIIFCTNAIDHIPHITHGLSEMERVLRKDGIIYLHVHIRKRKEINKAHIHCINLKRMKQMISKAKLLIQKAEESSDWVNKEDRKALYLELIKNENNPIS